jgi:hypothetical protein
MNHSTDDLNSSELQAFAQENDVPHLIPVRSLSDSGMFRQNQNRAKASIEDRP